MDKETSFIFDLDGTLWDARKEVAESWREIALQEFGFTHIDEALVASLMGLPMDEIAMAISPDFLPRDGKLGFGERAFAHENEYLSLHPGTPFEGVEETLRELRERGHRLFVVSNCQRGYIENFLNLMKPFEFDGHLCYGDTKKQKAFTILELMRREKIASALYVGDTEGDERETHLAGLPFVYASYGFGKALAPDYVIRRFADLLSL